METQVSGSKWERLTGCTHYAVVNTYQMWFKTANTSKGWDGSLLHLAKETFLPCRMDAGCWWEFGLDNIFLREHFDPIIPIKWTLMWMSWMIKYTPSWHFSKPSTPCYTAKGSKDMRDCIYNHGSQIRSMTWLTVTSSSICSLNWYKQQHPKYVTYRHFELIAPNDWPDTSNIELLPHWASFFGSPRAYILVGGCEWANQDSHTRKK